MGRHSIGGQVGNHVVVLGAQFGDEGKGKVMDALAADADVAIRFNGGANAGHTIVVGDVKTVLHLLPGGILRRGMTNVVGPYVVCDPEVLAAELVIAEAHGATVMLDARAPVVFPFHKQIDTLREGAGSGEHKIGTTGRGIGPCYEDFVGRGGPTLDAFVSPERLRGVLERRGYFDERRAVIRHHGGDPPTVDDLLAWAEPLANAVRAHVGDAGRVVADAVAANKNLLFEGAQGIMLDVVHGGRPLTTSSFCTLGAATTLGVHEFDRVVGVAKGYTTRVGSGPFPTELIGSASDDLRERGHEYGATTGRPRRCGWLDLPSLRYAVRVGGISELVLTKLDVLDTYAEIPVCFSYEGIPLDRPITLTRQVLEAARPEYQSFGGWQKPLGACRRWDDLPIMARAFIDAIERQAGIPVSGVSVGPEREQLIWR